MKENERLKIIRKKIGLTQKEFSEKLGITRSAYALIENGKISLSKKYINLLNALFSVSINWIENEEGEIFENKNSNKTIEEIFSELKEEDQKSFKDFIINKLKNMKDFSYLNEEMKEKVKNVLIEYKNI